MLVACCDQNFGNLDVALLEDDLALLVADDGRADLPLDFVERIDARQGEVPRKFQTRGFRVLLPPLTSVPFRARVEGSGAPD